MVRPRGGAEGGQKAAGAAAAGSRTGVRVPGRRGRAPEPPATEQPAGEEPGDDELFVQWNSQTTMKGALKILLELWSHEQVLNNLS